MVDHGLEEATWELDSDIKKKYMELFEKIQFRGRNFLKGGRM